MNRPTPRRTVLTRVLVGTLLLPTVLGALVLWSMGDRAENTHRVPAAVVDLDQPVTTGSGTAKQTVYAGRLLAAGLTSPEEPNGSTLGWELASADEAERGLRDGDYYAVITIPRDFSATLAKISGPGARQAGVTVQTVLRRFDSKEGLFTAAAEWGAARVAASRDVVPDEVEHAVTSLLDHYEAVGQGVLRMLAAAEGSPAIAAIVADGRAFHRQWCAASFPSALGGLSGVRRERRLAQLVAVCDVLTWKLLHLDAGLSRRQTHLALIELLGPLLVPSGEPA